MAASATKKRGAPADFPSSCPISRNNDSTPVAHEEKTFVFRLACGGENKNGDRKGCADGGKQASSCSFAKDAASSNDVSAGLLSDKSRMRDAGHCSAELIDALWATKSKLDVIFDNKNGKLMKTIKNPTAYFQVHREMRIFGVNLIFCWRCRSFNSRF